jgi:hypothetical protein
MKFYLPAVFFFFFINFTKVEAVVFTEKQVVSTEFSEKNIEKSFVFEKKLFKKSIFKPKKKKHKIDWSNEPKAGFRALLLAFGIISAFYLAITLSPIFWFLVPILAGFTFAECYKIILWGKKQDKFLAYFSLIFAGPIVSLMIGVIPTLIVLNVLSIVLSVIFYAVFLLILLI